MQANQNKGAWYGWLLVAILVHFSGGGGPSPAQPLQPQEAQQTGTR
jgi:hypothetical protein